MCQDGVRPKGDPYGRHIAVCGAPTLREDVVHPRGTKSGEERNRSSPLQIDRAPGGLPQAPGRAAESTTVARIYGHGSRDMRVLFGRRAGGPDLSPT